MLSMSYRVGVRDRRRRAVKYMLLVQFFETKLYCTVYHIRIRHSAYQPCRLYY